MKNSTYIQKKWMQFKVSTLSASITALIVSSMPTQISASDIDIYQMERKTLSFRAEI